MDDWCSQKVDNVGTTMSALTGILVPVTEYANLRRRFYASQRKWIVPKTNAVANPPELHGSDMLRHAPDEEKLEAYSIVARFVVENKIPIYRVGTT
jgi:hypothetical protein